MTLTHRWYCLAVLVVVLVSWSAVGQTNRLKWSVAEAGAARDGETDCTGIFQKLLDEAGAAGGGVVEVPAGRYRFNGGLSIPANVTLSGTYHVAPTLQNGPTGKLTGSVLLAYAGRGVTNGPPFIRLAGNNAVLTGFVITYPEWKQSDVPPVPYPPCVLCEHAENTKVSDCLLLNPYEAIKMVGAARHWIRDITGYPIKRGIYVDECYDIGHIENVHFWPFGVAFSPDNPFCKWVNTEGVAFELARTDWHYVFNTFCFGYGVGYKFSSSPHGSANGNFLGLGADSCERAVVVEQAQPPGLLFCNGEFVGRWSSTNAVCLDVGPKVEGKVSLVNCSFWGPIDRCVWMQSPVGQFTASACNFVNWDNRGVSSPAIQLDAGKAIVQCCTFAQEGLDVQVGSNVLSAILTANQADGGFRVENQAGKHTQSALNEDDGITWTSEALAHYQIVVGSEGDGRYLQGWHGREGGKDSYRWSGPVSRLVLPVASGAAYTLTLEGEIPPQAATPETGLYLEGKKIAALESGKVVRANLASGPGERMQLELRAGGWVPQQVVKDSKDPRTLGIRVSRITMRRAAAGTRIFNANRGIWVE